MRRKRCTCTVHCPCEDREGGDEGRGAVRLTQPPNRTASPRLINLPRSPGANQPCVPAAQHVARARAIDRSLLPWPVLRCGCVRFQQPAGKGGHGDASARDTATAARTGVSRRARLSGFYGEVRWGGGGGAMRSEHGTPVPRRRERGLAGTSLVWISLINVLTCD